MNSRRLWNSHQKHKLLRAEASWDILKLRAPKLPFPGFLRGILRRHVVSSEYMQDWEQCHRHVPGVPKNRTFEHFTDLNLFKFKYSFNVIQNWETNALQILFDAAHFLLAVMVEEDESSQLRMANYSQSFWPATGPY